MPVQRSLRLAALCAALLALAGATASAQSTTDPAQSPPCVATDSTQPLDATTNEPGIIGLHFFYAQGAEVSFFECVGARAVPLGRASDPSEITTISPAAFWRCDRVVRYFAATVTLPDGTLGNGRTDVRTSSCRHRFTLRVPARATLGESVRVRAYDTWNLGGPRGRLCVTPPGYRPDCQHVRFPHAINVVRRRLHLDLRGRWRVDFRGPETHLRETIAVGVRPTPAPRLPVILAAGDSTILGVDSFLADDLDGRARVVSDGRPGIAFSTPPGWEPFARRQVAQWHPRATVLSIGANEGFDMKGPDGVRHSCCGEDWAGELARRMRVSYRTYLRSGRGRVLALTIPAPRDAPRVPVFYAVNQAILQAAAGLPRVEVLRMDQVFSPHGFQAVIRYGGHDVRVRQDDGIHLNVAGMAIAARVIAKALARHPGLLRPTGS